MLVEVREREVITTENSMPKQQYKRRDVEEREQRWIGKRRYEQFNREKSEDIDKEKMWWWLQE